jgi:predicted CopG family antitoxin
MATTTITITLEAYNALKAKKKEGESFSNLILRTFQKSNASEIIAYYKEKRPDPELADAIEQSSKELRKNFKLRRVDL